MSWIDGERVLQAGLRLLPLLSSLVDGATQVEDEVGEGEDLARLRAAHLGSVHLAKSQVELSSEKPSPDLGVRGVVRVVLGDARRQGACHLAQGSLNLKRREDKYLENILMPAAPDWLPRIELEGKLNPCHSMCPNGLVLRCS